MEVLLIKLNRVTLSSVRFFLKKLKLVFRKDAFNSSKATLLMLHDLFYINAKLFIYNSGKNLLMHLFSTLTIIILVS